MAKQNTDANFYLNVTQYIEGWNIRSAPKKQAREVNKMPKLKPCPYRVHGERVASLTVAGEFYYNEFFLPCMGDGCAAYSNGTCRRNGAVFDMIMEEEQDG